MKKNGKLYGYNTDFYGMKFMAERAGVSLENKNVLILGGGATKDTAAYFAKTSGAKSVKDVSRNGPIDYENCYEYAADAQILINTTPVGSYGFDCRISVLPEKFKNLEAVFDCVYNPYNTPLLTVAKKLGLKCGHGVDMLVGQALASEEIWLGKTYPQNFKNEILHKTKEKTLNLVLIGMPSCGKTTIGAPVAEKLVKQFFDTDKIMETSENMSCENIFVQKGEKYFRAVEKSVVSGLHGVRGAVIATGGGTVEDEDNIKTLKENGVVVYIKRRLDLLETTGRALSKSIGVEKIYQRRRAIYEAACDVDIDNNGYIDDCVNGVIKLYENSCD